MENCLFCQIAHGEIPSELIYDDGQIVAFKDINPRAPVHILIIPKKHIDSLAEVTKDDVGLLGNMTYAAHLLAEQFGIAESGYRLVSNCRADSGQEVPHLHFHLLGGQKMGQFV